jgi:hypothetical protein
LLNNSRRLKAQISEITDQNVFMPAGFSTLLPGDAPCRAWFSYCRQAGSLNRQNIKDDENYLLADFRDCL